MDALLIAVAAFLATHTIPALPRLRGGLIAVLGWQGYMVGYSLLSLSVVLWVGVAYVQAPYQPLWDYDPRWFWVPILLMPWVCMAVVAGVICPNPLSVSFSRRAETGEGFDPMQPGLLRITRHPLLWGFLGWALAHIPPNGDGASLILFGLLAVLSLAGMFGLDAKRRRVLGVEDWRRLSQNAPLLPFTAGFCLTGRAGRHVILTVIGGLVLYGSLLLAHPWMIGVSPLP